MSETYRHLTSLSLSSYGPL